MGQMWAQNVFFFCNFLKFGSLVFFDVTYNDSWQECLTCSRGKIHEKKKKKIGPEFGSNWLKSDPRLIFLPFSQVWCISFLLNCIG